VERREIVRRTTFCKNGADRQITYVQIGVRGDHTSCAPGTIPIVGRDLEHSFLAKAHLHYPLVPSFNHLTNANGERKGTSLVATGVKLLTIRCQCTAVGRERKRVTRELERGV
jgi:hypothetical protein